MATDFSVPPVSPPVQTKLTKKSENPNKTRQYFKTCHGSVLSVLVYSIFPTAKYDLLWSTDGQFPTFLFFFLTDLTDAKTTLCSNRSNQSRSNQ